MKHVRGWILTWALVLVCGGVASAQQVDPEREKAIQFSNLFVEGLKAITARDLDRSARIWQACIQLYPERPTAYYNLACTLALGENAEGAVEALRNAYERGFVDLAHIDRDGDLEAIRASSEFQELRADLERQALQGVPDPLTWAPEGLESFPVVIYFHEAGQDPENALRAMTQRFPTMGWVVPQGPAVLRGGARGWDERAEFLAWRGVDALVEATKVEPSALFVVGQGSAGRLAMDLAVNNPERVAGVAAAGPGLDIGAGAESPVRAYLAVQADELGHVIAAVATRTHLAELGAEVVVEQRVAPRPWTSGDALERALQFLAGEDVKLPGEGVVEQF